jgi:hypothetical protein
MGRAAAAGGVHPIHGGAGGDDGMHRWYHWMRSVAHLVSRPNRPTPQFCAALDRVEALTKIFVSTGSSSRGAGGDDGWTLARFERCCKTAGSRLLDCDPDDEAYGSQSHDDEGGQV